tara:strand:- start:640 stop:948 length:309 start_codon:yes stop_codon:yes gene_type:complete
MAEIRVWYKKLELYAQALMREIVELENVPISDQATEDYLIQQISSRYHILHKLYDGECKRGHDASGWSTMDYHIVEGVDYLDELVYVFKHKFSGFAPRLKSD